MCHVAQACASGLSVAASHTEERDGTGWAVEWVLFPQLVMSMGCGLRHALALAETLQVDHAAIVARRAAFPSALSEAASFALARHMPRAQAQELVKRAARSERPFRTALQELSPAAIDWDEVLDPQRIVPTCRELASSIYASRLNHT